MPTEAEALVVSPEHIDNHRCVLYPVRMNASTFIDTSRSAPVRGAGCTIDLQPPALTKDVISQQASLHAALADPTRLGILALLAAQPSPLCACEVQEAFSLGQSTISHHLKILRDAGIVHCEKRGLWVYYWLDVDALRDISTSLQKLLPSSQPQKKGGN